MRIGERMAACLALAAVAAVASGQGPAEKSVKGTKKVTVTFKNTAGRSAQYFWVDFEGKQVSYGTIGRGEFAKQPTTEGHLWRFAIDGRPAGSYRATGAADQTYEITDPPAVLGRVTEPPENVKKALSLSPFYKKYTSANGLAVVSSAKVSDKALQEAAYLIGEMLIHRKDIVGELVKNKVRFAVMAPTEKTTDIPEHSDLTPKNYWDNRARGLGATYGRPAVSCGEENLLNLKGDPYNGENILVHEFAHAIHQMGMSSLDAKFDARLEKIYTRSLGNGLWKGTYAATNKEELWGEAVQSYFDTNLANDSQHNDASTRQKLARYDPDLFDLIDEVFKRPKWRYVRYDKRYTVAPATKAVVPVEKTIGPATKKGARVTVKMVNETGKTVSIYWMSDAKPVPYGELKPGESRDQVTYGGHGWLGRVEGRKQPATYLVPEKNDTWRVR